MRCEKSSVKASARVMLPSKHSASIVLAFATTHAKYRDALAAKPEANLMTAFFRFFWVYQKRGIGRAWIEARAGRARLRIQIVGSSWRDQRQGTGRAWVEAVGRGLISETVFYTTTHFDPTNRSTKYPL